MQHIYNLGAEMNDNWSQDEIKRDYMIMSYITIAIFIIVLGFIGYNICYWSAI
jgi:hypothetical protein